LLKQRATHWPLEDMDRVVDERRPQGYPMPPMVEIRPHEPEPLPGFYGPGFVGPVRQPQARTLPQRQEMRRSTVHGMVAPEEPVGEDEYRLLLNKLRASAGQDGPWR
jgi:hypothetical protein